MLNLDGNKIIYRSAVRKEIRIFFLECLFLNLMVDLILLAFCVVLIVVWPRFFYTWTFLFRIGFFVECVLTAILLFEKIDPVTLLGPNYTSVFTSFRYLSTNRLLGVRMAICLTYLFFFNWLIIILHIIVFAWESNVVSLQFLFYILLDILFCFEPWFAFGTIYSLGVYRNIKRFTTINC